MAPPADKSLYPFVLTATVAGGDLAEQTKAVKEKLTSAGFEVVGEVTPYENTNIVVATNDQLKEIASKTDFGAYGAGVRVAITKVKDEVQVSFASPTYFGGAYRMNGDLETVTRAVTACLAADEAQVKEFGMEKGMTWAELNKYHYKTGMPYFDEPMILATYGSYKEACDKLEENFAAKKDGVHKVYRIDIPGKEETVFGVRMTGGTYHDTKIMTEIDFKPLKSSAHLPYEVVVKEGKVYALSAKFRIAISFPDLSMVGSHSFASIMSCPNSIKKHLGNACSAK